VSYLFIHLKFTHWLLDGSTFVAQGLQFLWTMQFRNGYCTVCVCVCVWTHEDVRSVIQGGKFLSTRPTARIWHLQTFISSPKRKKKNLCAKRFKSHADVKHEVQTWLRSQDTTFYRQDFEKWIFCLHKYLNREGDYVEK